MNDFPLKHVCKTLRHKCGNYVYQDASKKLYFCCNYCINKCEDECKNVHTRCGQHCMRASKRIKEQPPGGFHSKKVVAINPDTKEIEMEYSSLTNLCESLRISPEVMRKRVKEQLIFRGMLYAFKEELEGQDNE